MLNLQILEAESQENKINERIVNIWTFSLQG